MGSAVRYSGVSTLLGSPLSAYFAYGLILLRAQDETVGRVLVGHGPVIAGVVQVHMHLACVGARELAELEVDHDQAAQSLAEEEQVRPIPGVADAEPLADGPRFLAVARRRRVLRQLAEEASEAVLVHPPLRDGDMASYSRPSRSGTTTPFRSRKTSAARSPVRLFPSTKGWFCATWNA